MDIGSFYLSKTSDMSSFWADWSSAMGDFSKRKEHDGVRLRTLHHIVGMGSGSEPLHHIVGSCQQDR
jgi:hypothetical protein